MQYLQFMFQDFGHFFGCLLLYIVTGSLVMLFIEGMVDRLTRLVYVWRLPVEARDVQDDDVPRPPDGGTNASIGERGR